MNMKTENIHIKGANPNNYVTFNNETAGWRIISINSDGTIKIMRDEDINTSNNFSMGYLPVQIIGFAQQALIPI